MNKTSISSLIKKKTFIIAEIGVNHNGSLALAKKMVKAAATCGADAVKFQTFKSENLASKFAPKANYQSINTKNINTSQLEMLKMLELPPSAFVKLKKLCDDNEVLFLSTPFDNDSVDTINELVPLFKVSSGDLTNLPLLRYIATKNKPIIFSTGMSTIPEIREAINTIKSVNSKVELSILHCTTNYPTAFPDVNLRAITTLKNTFNLPVGFSDHTLGIEAAIAAVSIGAKIIEKHFTLNRKLDGPDHKASSEPVEFNNMVNSIRNIELALGNGLKKPAKNENELIKVARKSIVAGKSIKKGSVISISDLAVKRPGTGIQPKHIKNLIGKKALTNIEIDTPLQWKHIGEHKK